MTRLFEWLRAARGSEAEVVGRLSDEGVCAERVPPSPEWTIRARLIHWSMPGCTPAPEPLEIVHRGTLDELTALQQRWMPGCEVRARVRMRHHAHDAELVRVVRIA